MIIIYILLNYILFEFLNFKNLNKQKIFGISFFNLMILISILFERVNVLDFVFVSVSSLYLLIPLFLALLVNNIFEYKYNYSDIVLNRVLLISQMVVVLNFKIIFVVASIVVLFYELFCRSKQVGFAIKSNLKYLVCLILLTPVFNSLQFNISSNIITTGIIILLFFIDFNKMSIYRILSCLFISSFLLLNNSHITVVLLGISLFLKELLTQLWKSHIFNKKPIKIGFIDWALQRSYVFFEQKEIRSENKFKVCTKRSIEGERDNQRVSIHGNDIFLNFLIISYLFCLLGLFIIFRN